jgi:hypothetical protein
MGSNRRIIVMVKGCGRIRELKQKGKGRGMIGVPRLSQLRLSLRSS